MQYCTSEWLADAGVLFEDPEDETAFLAHMQKHLEIRIGNFLCMDLSPEQMDEFDRIIDHESDERAKVWLDTNIPNYTEIIDQCKKDLSEELHRYRADLPGTLWPESALNDPPSVLGFTQGETEALRDTLILNVGSLLATDMQGISAICRAQRLDLNRLLRLTRPISRNRILLAARRYADLFGYDQARRDFRALTEANDWLEDNLTEGTPISHDRYGNGTVISCQRLKLRVSFPGFLPKSFSLRFASTIDHLDFPDPQKKEQLKAYAPLFQKEHTIKMAWHYVCDRLGIYLSYLREMEASEAKKQAS